MIKDKLSKLLIIFKENTDQPKDDANEKWYFVGFFSAIMVFFIVFMPMLFLSGQLKQVTDLSFAWFTLLLSMVAWPLFLGFLASKYLFNFSLNFGLMMYAEYQADKKKKAARKEAA